MRRGPILPDGTISRGVRAAIALRRRLLQDGRLIVEADLAVGRVLARVWGRSTRDVVARDATPYVCETCRDTGWIEADPNWPQLERLYGRHVEGQLTYLACDPCAYRQAQRVMRRGTEESDSPAGAGRSTRRLSR